MKYNLPSAPGQIIQSGCQRPDAIRAAIPSAYTVIGSNRMPIDEEGKLHWHIANWSDDLDPSHQIGIFAKVFASFQAYLYPWQFVSTSDYEKSDWKIFVAKGNHIRLPSGDLIESPFDFNDAPDAIAVQFISTPGVEHLGMPLHQTMILNDSYVFALGAGPNRKDLFKIVQHEGLHGMKIGHTNYPGDIMNPKYDSTATITVDTLNAIYDIHGDHLLEYMDKLEHSRRLMKLMNTEAPIVEQDKEGCLLALRNYFRL